MAKTIFSNMASLGHLQFENWLMVYVKVPMCFTEHKISSKTDHF